MNVKDLKRYEGEKVILVLTNGFRYTAVLPKIVNTTFIILDKFEQEVTIDCEIVKLITKVWEK